jgi:hypothetical protein
MHGFLWVYVHRRGDKRWINERRPMSSRRQSLFPVIPYNTAAITGKWQGNPSEADGRKTKVAYILDAE